MEIRPKRAQRFYYDYRNQLVRVSEGGATTSEYKYDALGRRFSKQLPNSSNHPLTSYYFSGNHVIEERDGSDNVLKQYIYGNGIDEILRMDKNENGAMVHYYFHTNAINSNTAVTDKNGNIIERYSYDIYGMPIIKNANGDVISQSAIGNEYMFHGRRYDKETNLYYFRARYYDPIMGRFLSVDPMGYKDSMNLYQAFNQNPVNIVDPMGKWWVSEHRKMILYMLFGYELQENLNESFGYYEYEYNKPHLFIPFLKGEKTKGRCPKIYAGTFEIGLLEGSVWPDAPNGYIEVIRQLMLIKDPSSMEMKSHHGILQFWHFMFDPRYHPRSPKLYINKVINWVVGFIKKGVSLLGEGKDFKGGKYIGIAMHIIQDSFAPSHAARNEKMEITRIQDYRAQSHKKHRKLGDFKKGNVEYWNAAVKACRTILELILQNNFDEQQIRNELWKIFKYNKTYTNEEIMGGTEERYLPDD